MLGDRIPVRPRHVTARTWLAIAVVAVCADLSTAKPASAAFGYTDLVHDDGTYVMHGYTLTALDWWESVTGEMYYDPCECYLLYVNQVVVGGILYTPQNQVAAFVPPIVGSSEALIVLLPFHPWQVGAWRGVGAHSLRTHYYQGASYLGVIETPLGSTQRIANAGCIVPTTEVTMSGGWNSQWPTSHDFAGQLKPDIANFVGARVAEFQPHAGNDGCYVPGLMPESFRFQLTGGDWFVGTGNVWQWDTVGFEPNALTQIRSIRAQNGLPMPCHITVPQEMIVASCPNAPSYAVHNLTITIGLNDVTVGRAGVSITRTWPVGPPPPGGNALDPGDELYPDGYRESLNGQYRLVYQGSDGNLVLYGPSGPTWASYTSHIAGFVAMQGDGNLVVYDSAGVARWNSATHGNSGAFLRVQDDGNVVIYNSGGAPIWWAP